MRIERSFRFIAVLMGFYILLTTESLSQDWQFYGGDRGGMRYSAIDEINVSNVDDLEVAWVYRTGEAQRRGEVFQHSAFENTPILVAGHLIVCTPFNRIVALDPASGAARWVFEPNVALDHAPGMYKCRGVASWRDEAAAEGALCRTRILIGSVDSRLIAIDAKTGRRCPGFGNNGEVALPPTKELLFPGEMSISSPPAVVNGIVVVGSQVLDNVRAAAPHGPVRAFDARTGALRWEFDPIPIDPLDPAADTWGGDSPKTTGGTNVWSMMSVDEERDLIFLPTSSPSPDFYGGKRPGENRYANSIVALRGATGEMVWHFQHVHHDMWDYDTPSQPLLADLPHNGKTVPALIQTTKQSLVFVLNRETGEPLFPIEERPAPQAGVPGEWVSPTQPFPVAPPPLVKQGIWPEDAWGFTFLDEYVCRKRIAALRHGPFYTPPSLQGTIVKPAYLGGVNWGGGAFDPQRKLLVVNTNRVPAVIKLLPQSDRKTVLDEDIDLEQPIVFPQSGTPYMAENIFLLSPLGAPCTPPPWGGLTAVDLIKGTIKWDVTLGSIEKLLPVPIPLELGTPSLGGPLVTGGGLVFIAATMDDKFRAFDIDTGEKLWQVKLPAGGQASPMTYRAEGRQFVVIAAGGHAMLGTTLGDYIIAYALPR